MKKLDPSETLIAHKARLFWKEPFAIDANGCWNWTRDFRCGYGYLNIRHGGTKRHFPAHRLSWEIHFGEIPKDKVVCHECDNSGCCNPHHLFLGTQDENMEDMKLKGRHGNCRPIVNIELVVKRLSEGATCMEIAREIGVHRTSIGKIKAGRTRRNETRLFPRAHDGEKK